MFRYTFVHPGHLRMDGLFHPTLHCLFHHSNVHVPSIPFPCEYLSIALYCVLFVWFVAKKIVRFVALHGEKDKILFAVTPCEKSLFE